MLADGPWARHRYWRADLEAVQAASRAVGYPDDHPSAVLRRYHPTADHDTSTGPEAAPVRLWRYQPLQVGPGRPDGPSSPSRHGRGR